MKIIRETEPFEILFDDTQQAYYSVGNIHIIAIEKYTKDISEDDILTCSNIWIEKIRELQKKLGQEPKYCKEEVMIDEYKRKIERLQAIIKYS